MPHVPINLAIEEPEAGGSLAPIGSRPVWATQWDSISKCKIKYVGRWFGPNACPRSRRADQTRVIHVRLQGTRWKPSFLIQLLRNECQIPKQPFVAGMVSKSSVTKPLQEKRDSEKASFLLFPASASASLCIFVPGKLAFSAQITSTLILVLRKGYAQFRDWKRQEDWEAEFIMAVCGWDNRREPMVDTQQVCFQTVISLMQ